MHLVLVTNCILDTLLSEITSHLNSLYKLSLQKELCKYLYNCKTYGLKTSALALTKDIYDSN